MKQKVKDLSSRCSLKGSIAVIVVILMFVSITLGIALMKKTVSVVIDGKEKKIVTCKSNLNEILTANSIRLESKDKVNVNLDSRVKDGDKIYIKKAVNVKVNVDGEDLSIKTTENSVGDMLKAQGIVLKTEDKVIPSKSEKIINGLNVSIVRVTAKVVKESKDIGFTTVMKKDDNLVKGKKKVVRTGQKGQKLIATKVMYENGKEVSRKVVSENVAKKPVTQIVAIGTLGVVRSSRGSGDYGYKNVVKVRATAYTASASCTGKSAGDPYFGITATGTRAKRDPSGYSTIAVDPRVIPLGTKVYVEGYGLAIAEDVGGAIKGNRIDIFLNSESQSNDWGVRWVNMYILK